MGKDLKGKELGVGINQRKDGKYQGRYVDRFGKRISIYDYDLKVLRRKLNEAIYEDENAMSVTDKKITLDSWFDQWMQVYKLPVISESSVLLYKNTYRKIISPLIGMYAVADLTQMHIQNVLNIAKQKGYSWEVQSTIKILCTDILHRALEMNLIKKDPMRGVRVPSNKPQSQVQVLTVTQQLAFLECSAGTFYHNMFVVAVNSGLRPGEIFALTESDIDFSNRVIHVNKTLVYQAFTEGEGKVFHVHPPKTKSSVRDVPITDTCLDALQRQIKQKKVVADKHPATQLKDLLFTTKYNTPINSQIYNEAIRRIVMEMNLTRDKLEEMPEISGHTFRHTFATRCIEAGIRPKTLQTYLGHATLNMTMDLYVHVTDEVKHEELKLLDKRISEVKDSYGQN